MRRLRRLLHKRSLRWEEGVCVLEGPDLIDAALDAGAPFEALFVDRASLDEPGLSALVQRVAAAGGATYSLEPGVLDKVADVQAPQPVLATVRFTTSTLADLDRIDPLGLVMVLDDLRDPGNAGTIIRSSDAAGASAVVLSGDCVDPFNPKTLRASAGSVFHLPLIVAGLEETLEYLRARGGRSFATVVRGGTPLRTCDLSGPCAAVIGNEAAGLDETALSLCDETMTIEMDGRAESLNAGVAASLVAFEALHQRRGTTSA